MFVLETTLQNWNVLQRVFEYLRYVGKICFQKESCQISEERGNI